MRGLVVRQLGEGAGGDDPGQDDGDQHDQEQDAEGGRKSLEQPSGRGRGTHATILVDVTRKTGRQGRARQGGRHVPTTGSRLMAGWPWRRPVKSIALSQAPPYADSIFRQLR
ncbi:hypothetical protein LHGZ1_0300 [Laribacter hongkongensis]|uniref:Uncharacterized protein n=1 Tax=Laribacter hongkongensis TaxID=168471 RepID=A0A248LF41_9NEIS|nr:hypothetical protein LHGZ1_0300 [Laribacter hongkongensis]